MKLIPLSKGKFAKVDDCDFVMLNGLSWHLHQRGEVYYAVTLKFMGIGKYKMHRLLLGLTHKDGIIVDHIDGDGLNNQRSNLRIVTTQQNGFNRRNNINSFSKYKGVNYHKKQKTFRANIKINGKPIFIGNYKSEIDAARAYNEKAKELFGEFANINIIK